ncbi:hypothetical protein L2E82_24787 [Cichorium intybus]|uniref:Uncharacterized protein n=1 Tax=Cichorium intybus TaxID=13427 RepID=A0ACB9E203_CICIN|nr:hypothetical protein L2E82_24787 [Cichorium intybus]
MVSILLQLKCEWRLPMAEIEPRSALFSIYISDFESWWLRDVVLIECPPWFSSGAKTLLSRILDPNPKIKGYKPPNFEQEEDFSLDDVDAVFNESKEHLVTEKKEKPESMNTFELISRSQGFSLENMFEKQKGFVKRETSFASKCPANEIMSKIKETAKPMGFNVHKRNYKIMSKIEEGTPCCSYRGRLALATTDLSLEEAFSQCGEILESKI